MRLFFCYTRGGIWGGEYGSLVLLEAMMSGIDGARGFVTVGI